MTGHSAVQLFVSLALLFETFAARAAEPTVEEAIDEWLPVAFLIAVLMVGFTLYVSLTWDNKD